MYTQLCNKYLARLQCIHKEVSTLLQQGNERSSIAKLHLPIILGGRILGPRTRNKKLRFSNNDDFIPNTAATSI